MPRNRPLTLSIPAQKRDALSFCDGSPQAIEAWSAALHTLDAAQALPRLLPAVIELNQCRTPTGQRFAQLEAIRPVVWFVCNRLSQTMLEGPMLLATAEQQQLQQAQQLQTHLAAGYKLVLAHELQAGGKVHTVALDRALTELGQTLLRALQLYTGAPARLWSQLHQLYALAERRGVLDAVVDDPLQKRSRPGTLRSHYMRLLLLGCARPNMLRQRSLSVLFLALEEWSEMAGLRSAEDDSRLLVDLSADLPPVESMRYEDHPDEDRRCLDVDELLGHLRERFEIATRERAHLSDGSADDPELLSHLIQSWGRSARRAFKRTPADGTMELCVGLDALHYHNAGGVSLRAQLRGRHSQRQEQAEEEVLDPFAGAGDVGGARMEQHSPRRSGTPISQRDEEEDGYPLSNLRLEDISPGGYGLVSTRRPEQVLQAGELVGLRQPGARQWSIAVVRWCRNEPGELRLGVELLAPQAASACVRPIGSEQAWDAWGPALVLPAVQALQHPPSLITGSGVFGPGQKVLLNQYGNGLRARLEVLERTSHGFAEYRFEALGDPQTGAVALPAEDALEDEDDGEIEIELTGTGPWSGS